MDVQEEDFTPASQVTIDVTARVEPVADAVPEAPYHVMIGTETLALGNKPAFLSLGAVKFDENDILDRFHVGIDPQSAQNLGMDINASTVLWWMDEERADARREIMALERIDLPSALLGFAAWCGRPAGVWSNGATANIVWMRNAFEAAGLEVPWSYKVENCFRTKKNEYPDVTVEAAGTSHTALADADYQARHLQAIWKAQDQTSLREMLRECADQFSYYEASHRAKETPDGERKADVNAKLASRIEALIGPKA